MTHKYGIEVPRSLKDALALDAKNGNKYWSEAVGKEMGTIVVAFKILEPNACPPPGWRTLPRKIAGLRMDTECPLPSLPAT